jgi:hypothetical protein
MICATGTRNGSDPKALKSPAYRLQRWLRISAANASAAHSTEDSTSAVREPSGVAEISPISTPYSTTRSGRLPRARPRASVERTSNPWAERVGCALPSAFSSKRCRVPGAAPDRTASTRSSSSAPRASSSRRAAGRSVATIETRAPSGTERSVELRRYSTTRQPTWSSPNGEPMPRTRTILRADERADRESGSSRRCRDRSCG